MVVALWMQNIWAWWRDFERDYRKNKTHTRRLPLSSNNMQYSCPLPPLQTLFPIPGLKTKVGGHDMFYIRPSVTFQMKCLPNQSLIIWPSYVIHAVMEQSCHADTHGIGFIACMDDWTMKSFDVDYCLQFMMMLHGYVIPIKVQLFLIVNPPIWFDVFWKIMKTMLAQSF
jgi:hypothetical protein